MSEPQSLRGLSFDDVLIRPQRTGVSPWDVSLQAQVVRGYTSDLPLISAPMSTVFSPRLACALAPQRVLAPLPRELSRTAFESVAAGASWQPIVATTSPFRPEEVLYFLAHPKVDYLILDSVVAHHDKVFELLDSLSPRDLRRIILGNIATSEAARDFSRFELGAVKVGLGPGSICTTSIRTGVGVPQLQAISEVAMALVGTGISVIADGGIRSTGDIAKALAAGADGVMLGRLFAGSTEGGGEIVERGGIEYKVYNAAEYSTIELPSNTGNFDFDKAVTLLIDGKAHRSEGISGLTHHTGPASILVEHIGRALRASMAFVGAVDLRNFRRRARLEPISHFARIHASDHGVPIVTRTDRLTGGDFGIDL